MKMSEFKLGDKVILKTGGPEMVIDLFDEDRKQFLCVWSGNQEWYSPHLLKCPDPPGVPSMSNLHVDGSGKLRISSRYPK